MADAGGEVIDQKVWEDLQSRIEDDTRIRDVSSSGEVGIGTIGIRI